MWQIEDLIRAFKLDIDAINDRIIKPYPVSDDERKALYDWYESMIEMMIFKFLRLTGQRPGRRVRVARPLRPRGRLGPVRAGPQRHYPMDLQTWHA